jgi:hypothetical protein
VLLLLQLHLGARAHANDGHTPGQLGQPLLQLLFVIVIVRGAGFNLGLDLVDPPQDVLAVRDALPKGYPIPAGYAWGRRPILARTNDLAAEQSAQR